jgi:4a-hydroxytetrahydrobiopterin dehydratase
MAQQGGQRMNAQDGQKTYATEAVEARLAAELPRWQFREGHLCRKYQTHGWKGTLMVVNTIGHLAEVAWHHPDLSVTYNGVEVRLMSHDVKGITGRDFALAKKIEEVVLWQPNHEGGPFTGTPQDPRYAYIKYG